MAGRGGPGVILRLLRELAIFIIFHLYLRHIYIIEGNRLLSVSCKRHFFVAR